LAIAIYTKRYIRKIQVRVVVRAMSCAPRQPAVSADANGFHRPVI